MGMAVIRAELPGVSPFDMTKRNLLKLSLAALVASSACDADEADLTPASFETETRGDLVRCGTGAYDFLQINGLLRDNPELADALGVATVESCEDAQAFIDDSLDLVESFPSEPLDPAGDEFRVAAAEASHLTEDGIIRLRFPTASGGTSSCTGVLVHERAVITSAHCVDQLAPGGAKNFDAYGIAVDNFGGGKYDGKVRINIHPDYVGGSEGYAGSFDVGDDLAVVKLNYGSFGFSSDARHRIYVGPLGMVGAMKFFGQGVNSNAGGAGTLRRMSYTPTWAGPEHFFNNASGPSRVCLGDSGGPALDYLPSTGAPVVMGLAALIEVNDGEVDMCAKAGGKQSMTRLQNKISFIDQALGGTDSDDCAYFDVDGWQYYRCFA